MSPDETLIGRAEREAKKRWGWSDPPGDLGAQISYEPYPLDALPATIGEAVKEVREFVKAPVPLVATSALAASSVVIQGHVNVKRAAKLVGPVSLFSLAIAPSGERKTTCDGFFATAIRDYEQTQTKAAEPELREYKAKLDAWSAERDGLLAAIKQAAKTGKETEGFRLELLQLERKCPKQPQVPMFLRGDETPENLAWGLTKEWSSSGILCSEGGAILGAHGMNRDCIMRNLALLNLLWDGGTLRIGRRTSESFCVQYARLTLGLQIQDEALRSFFDRSNGLARGIGFLARFLIAWPESTQGQRPFSDPPKDWPRLHAFHRRITEILNTPWRETEDGELDPIELSFDARAKDAWIVFHNEIEAALGNGKELYDVRDAASKTAENCARLAALFHVFESGVDGAIGLESVASAARVVAWHLNESRRFFGELVLPESLGNARRLDAWLIEFCRRSDGRTNIVPISTAQRLGPGQTRRREKIEEAIRELEQVDHARLVPNGRRREIHVNPHLLNGGKE